MTNLLAASLVYAQMLLQIFICNVSYQRPGRVSQLERRHRRRWGEVPERLSRGRPLGLGEAVTRRDDDEESAYGVGFARDFASFLL